MSSEGAVGGVRPAGWEWSLRGAPNCPRKKGFTEHGARLSWNVSAERNTTPSSAACW